MRRVGVPETPQSSVLWSLWTSPLRGPARALRAVWTARGQRSRVAHRLPTLSRLSPTSSTGPITNHQLKTNAAPRLRLTSPQPPTHHAPSHNHLDIAPPAADPHSSFRLISGLENAATTPTVSTPTATMPHPDVSGGVSHRRTRHRITPAPAAPRSPRQSRPGIRRAR